MDWLDLMVLNLLEASLAHLKELLPDKQLLRRLTGTRPISHPVPLFPLMFHPGSYLLFFSFPLSPPSLNSATLFCEQLCLGWGGQVTALLCPY